MATVCIPQPAICVRRPRTTATGRRGGGVALGLRWEAGAAWAVRPAVGMGRRRRRDRMCDYGCRNPRLCVSNLVSWWRWLCFTSHRYRTDHIERTQNANRTRNSPCGRSLRASRRQAPVRRCLPSARGGRPIVPSWCEFVPKVPPSFLVQDSGQACGSPRQRAFCSSVCRARARSRHPSSSAAAAACQCATLLSRPTATL